MMNKLILLSMLVLVFVSFSSTSTVERHHHRNHNNYENMERNEEYTQTNTHRPHRTVFQNYLGKFRHHRSPSFIQQLSSLSSSPTIPPSSSDPCELCVYTVSMLSIDEHFNCRLDDPIQLNLCRDVIETSTSLKTNSKSNKYLTYGCFKNNKFVSPCPAHAICGWAHSLALSRTYCSPHSDYSME